MKSIFLSILLLLGLLSNATTYYFSNTVAYSGAATGDAAHPFRNPSAMDSILRGIYPGVTAAAGDQFLFKRGDVFPIIKTITPTKNGTTSLPYIIDAYGSGNKPVFTSFQRITSWTSLGGNKYRAQIPGSGSLVSLLLLGSSASNGVFQPIGRWPNRNALSAVDGKSYAGYLDIEDIPTTSKLVDNNYTAETVRPTDDWTGAEVAIRNRHYRFIRKTITSNSLSGAAMTYNLSTTDAYDSGLPGWGYFLQNHIACLDQQGEWAYDGSKDSVYIYLINSPTNYYIQVPTVNGMIDFGNQDNYVVNNIEFWGSNKTALASTNLSFNINITNCVIMYSGENAIEFNAGGHVIEDNYIDYTLTKAVETYLGDCIIRNNIIRNTGPVMGMNFNTNIQGSAIDAYGDNVLVEYNKIYNSALCAIDINDGSNQRVTKNFIDSANVRVDDGGSIYTANLKDVFTYRNKVIDSNILLHTWLPETYVGLPRIYNHPLNTAAYAIYGDKWTDRWKVEGNIVDGAQGAVYFNDPSFDTIKNNILYNYGQYGLRIHTTAPVDASHPTPHDNLGIGNVYYSNSSASPFYAEAFDADKTSGIPEGYGTFKDQYFVYPFYQTGDDFFKSTSKRFTWYKWDSAYAYDHTKNFFRRTNPSGSTSSNISKLIYNPNKYDSVVNLGGKTWIEPRTGKEYLYDTAILAPFTGRVLVYTAKTVLALANAAPKVTLDNPINNAAYTAPAFITLQATASDDDGTIVSVKFYSGNVLLGTGTLSNGVYTYSWLNIGAGAYALTAVATDNLGATTTTGVSTIIVASTTNTYQSPVEKYKTRGIKFYKKTN